MNTDMSLHLQQQVERAYKDKIALRIVGGESKAFYGRVVAAESISVAEHRGVLNYEPTELVITARAGTPLNEIEALLDQHDLDVEFFGECPVCIDSASDKIISVIKRTAVTCHLMPKTMKGKKFLKRLIFGRLLTLDAEIKDGVVEYCPPIPISCEHPNSQYKILYAVARVP